MKLIIENIDKMEHQLIPTRSDDYTWKVDSVQESDLHYHFLCERWNSNAKIDYVCKLSIVRESEDFISESYGGFGSVVSYYYRIKIDHNPTIHFLYNNEVKSMFEVMEKFASILNRIPH